MGVPALSMPLTTDEAIALADKAYEAGGDPDADRRVVRAAYLLVMQTALRVGNLDASLRAADGFGKYTGTGADTKHEVTLKRGGTPEENRDVMLQVARAMVADADERPKPK